MTQKQSFLLTAAIVAVIAFVSAAAFTAYLKPAMLVEFANLVLCN
jgi:hypothetical protein